MLDKIIHFSLRNKLIVVLFTLTISAYGIYAIMQIPVGAVPDITNNQVQVITTSGNLSTQEIEQFITAPVELEMANLPGVLEIRSVSKFGLSVVTIVFRDDVGTYLPRQLIAEKIKAASANIPEGFGTPEMGPITTGLGEIYQYILDVKPGYEKRYTAMELRTIQDWIVRRQLSGINGVVEVNSWGGYLKQYEVAIDPARLRSLNITLMEVFDAIGSNNSISGGAYIEKTNQSYFIRGDGQVKSARDIENIAVRNTGGIPILVRDLAVVRDGFANRFGAITANGEGEKVLGQVMMLKNANSKLVINEVKKRVAEVQKSLPEGVFINPILERSELIGKTSFTVVENLVLGCLIVVLIVILLLGNVRSALVIASMIPLSLLFTLSMMYIFGIDANLMSLGALDFGIIIDGAVIIVEFIALRITLSRSQYSQLHGTSRQSLLDRIVYDGTTRMMNSAVFGQVIILIVFIPILSLSGVEGKMFRPMALSFSFAILGAMLFGLTWLPVASSYFLRPEKETKRSLSKWVMDLAYRSYTPVMAWAIGHKKIVLGTAVAAMIFTVILFGRMGGEFVPTLDEGDFVIQPVLKTGTSLSKTIELTTRMENILIKKFPEVDQIVSRIGAAEVPTDPMSMEEIDMIIKLKPRKEWVSAKNKEELADQFKEALSVIPGIEYEFTQPIEMRFNELITGVRADIAVKLFGDDLEYLAGKAADIKKIIEDIPGASDVILEKTAGLPQMNVTYRRDKIAYYGLDIKTLNTYLAMAFGGQAAGSVFEGERRFDLVLRLQQEHRQDIENIRKLQVPMPNGIQVPLEELADIRISEGPAKISRDNTHRRVVVSVNVRNRDLQSVVNDIQARINEKVQLEPGNYIAYGGQFENLQNATKRLTFAVPIALLLIFVFLHFAFKSLKDALMIFTAVPLATVGGVLALWLRDMPFSVSAGIGFIALFGIAVLNGIVLIEHLKHLKEKGIKDMRELILSGTRDRLRPVLLTAAAAAMGFLPMAISNGSGAEVQRPLATVVIGGLISSTLLTMIALPLLFEIFNNMKGIRVWTPRLARRKTLLITAILGFTAFSAGAQQQEISLQDALKIAMENNRELKASRLMVEEQQALKPTAYNLDKTLLSYGYDQNNIAENGSPLNVLGIEQNFSFPSLYSAQRKANSINVAMAATSLRKQQMVLSREVSMAYYEILYLQSKISIFRRIDSLYQGFTAGEDKRYQRGGISRLDLLNAKAKQQKVTISLNELGNSLDMAYQHLKSLMQAEAEFRVPSQELSLVLSRESATDSLPDLQFLKEQREFQEAMVKVERRTLIPDFSVNYFQGRTAWADPDVYHGVQLGLALPLFFGEQKARIRAGQIAVSISENLHDNELMALRARQAALRSELKKYGESIEAYNSAGKELGKEILRSSQLSLDAGEIDAFQWLLSVENALGLVLDYMDNVMKYNQVALEINYLTN